MDSADPFVAMVNGPASEIDLARGALLLAAHAHPAVDVDAELGVLADLAAGCPEPTFAALRDHLFVDLGFTGATDYYAPENSFLDHVLATRRGIPITLALVTIEVGRRIGVPVVGIGMPGHFLVGRGDAPGVYLDPFDAGRALDVAGCEAVFRRLAGERAPFQPGYLRPVDDVTILCRMVANLVNAYRRADDLRGLRWAVRLRSECPGVGPQELVQLAMGAARTHGHDLAAALYDRAADGLRGEEAERWRLEAQRQRARLN